MALRGLCTRQSFITHTRTLYYHAAKANQPTTRSSIIHLDEYESHFTDVFTAELLLLAARSALLFHFFPLRFCKDEYIFR